VRPRSITAARPRDYLLARRAKRAGAKRYALRAIIEAERPTSRVSPSLALALIEQESGFRNVFGCDHGPGKAYCHQGVTRAKVQALRRSGLMNGVGPAQLTWKGYVEEADRDGGAHKTSVNIATGIRILDSHIKATGSEFKALATYNAGNPNSQQGQRYARQVLERKAKYHRALT
jgi:soluble lytic murein transglycosylase-like protein